MSEGVELTVSEKTNVYPYLSLTGDGCMTVRASNVKSGERVYICDKYKTPLDISGYNTVFFPINVKSVAPGKAVYKAGIELISSESAFVSESEAYSETWSGIFADVSTWNGRPDLCEIRIYLVYETEPDKETPRPFEFCIDSLCLSESENAVFSARFLSGSLSFSGAEGVYEKDGIRVKGTGNTFTVSFDGVSPELFLSANSLKLRFVSESVKKIVLLDKDKKERYSCVIEGDDPVRTCYLALSPSFFPFSLKFECDNDPEVEIKAVVPYSMYFPEKETGKLEVCSASAGENAVTVKGSVFENAFAVYSGSVLHLFALEPSSPLSEETLTDDNKLSSLTLNSPEFSFRVPAGTEEDPKSALYKKYVAAIEYGGELIPVGDGIFVTNPEIFASNGARISKNTGRRGYTSLSPDTMLDSGGKATRVYADFISFRPRPESKRKGATAPSTILPNT